MPSCANCQNLACRKKVDYQVKAGNFCDHAKLPPWRRNVSAFFLRAAGLCPGWQRKTPEYIEEQRRAKAAEERYAAESAKAEEREALVTEKPCDINEEAELYLDSSAPLPSVQVKKRK